MFTHIDCAPKVHTSWHEARELSTTVAVYSSVWFFGIPVADMYRLAPVWCIRCSCCVWTAGSHWRIIFETVHWLVLRGHRTSTDQLLTQRINLVTDPDVVQSWNEAVSIGGPMAGERSNESAVIALHLTD